MTPQWIADYYNSALRADTPDESNVWVFLRMQKPDEVVTGEDGEPSVKKHPVNGRQTPLVVKNGELVTAKDGTPLAAHVEKMLAKAPADQALHFGAAITGGGKRSVKDPRMVRSRTLCFDLDDMEGHSLDELDEGFYPDLLWETSPGSYQCAYIVEDLPENVDPFKHRNLGSRFIETLHADKGAKDFAHNFRAPGRPHTKESRRGEDGTMPIVTVCDHHVWTGEHRTVEELEKFLPEFTEGSTPQVDVSNAEGILLMAANAVPKNLSKWSGGIVAALGTAPTLYKALEDSGAGDPADILSSLTSLTRGADVWTDASSRRWALASLAGQYGMPAGVLAGIYETAGFRKTSEAEPGWAATDAARCLSKQGERAVRNVSVEDISKVKDERSFGNFCTDLAYKSSAKTPIPYTVVLHLPKAIPEGMSKERALGIARREYELVRLASRHLDDLRQESSGDWAVPACVRVLPKKPEALICPLTGRIIQAGSVDVDTRIGLLGGGLIRPAKVVTSCATIPVVSAEHSAHKELSTYVVSVLTRDGQTTPVALDPQQIDKEKMQVVASGEEVTAYVRQTEPAFHTLVRTIRRCWATLGVYPRTMDVKDRWGYFNDGGEAKFFSGISAITRTGEIAPLPSDVVESLGEKNLTTGMYSLGPVPTDVSSIRPEAETFLSTVKELARLRPTSMVAGVLAALLGGVTVPGQKIFLMLSGRADRGKSSAIPLFASLFYPYSKDFFYTASSTQKGLDLAMAQIGAGTLAVDDTAEKTDSLIRSLYNDGLRARSSQTGALLTTDQRTLANVIMSTNFPLRDEAAESRVYSVVVPDWASEKEHTAWSTATIEGARRDAKYRRSQVGSAYIQYMTSVLTEKFDGSIDSLLEAYRGALTWDVGGVSQYLAYPERRETYGINAGYYAFARFCHFLSTWVGVDEGQVDDFWELMTSGLDDLYAAKVSSRENSAATGDVTAAAAFRSFFRSYTVCDSKNDPIAGKASTTVDDLQEVLGQRYDNDRRLGTAAWLSVDEQDITISTRAWGEFSKAEDVPDVKTLCGLIDGIETRKVRPYEGGKPIRVFRLRVNTLVDLIEGRAEEDDIIPMNFGEDEDDFISVTRRPWIDFIRATDGSDDVEKPTVTAPTYTVNPAPIAEAPTSPSDDPIISMIQSFAGGDSVTPSDPEPVAPVVTSFVDSEEYEEKVREDVKLGRIVGVDRKGTFDNLGNTRGVKVESFDDLLQVIKTEFEENRRRTIVVCDDVIPSDMRTNPVTREEADEYRAEHKDEDILNPATHILTEELHEHLSYSFAALAPKSWSVAWEFPLTITNEDNRQASVVFPRVENLNEVSDREVGLYRDATREGLQEVWKCIPGGPDISKRFDMTGVATRDARQVARLATIDSDHELGVSDPVVVNTVREMDGLFTHIEGGSFDEFEVGDADTISQFDIRSAYLAMMKTVDFPVGDVEEADYVQGMKTQALCLVDVTSAPADPDIFLTSVARTGAERNFIKDTWLVASMVDTLIGAGWTVEVKKTLRWSRRARTLRTFGESVDSMRRAAVISGSEAAESYAKALYRTLSGTLALGEEKDPDARWARPHWVHIIVMEMIRIMRAKVLKWNATAVATHVDDVLVIHRAGDQPSDNDGGQVGKLRYEGSASLSEVNFGSVTWANEARVAIAEREPEKEGDEIVFEEV